MKQLAVSGAKWVTLMSGVAAFLAFYRSWILGQIDDVGEVVGSFAIVLLFIEMIATFFVFGGSSVVTNFFPKIEKTSDKAAFLTAYGIISIVLAIVCVALNYMFPGLFSALTGKSLDGVALRALSLLIPIVVLAQICVFCLAGLMEFRLVSLLNQVQLVSICVFSTTAWYFFPDFLQAHSIAILALIAGGANVFVFLIAGKVILKSVGRLTTKLYLPPNFWRFSIFIHLNTILTFAYRSIDQLVVLSTIGIAELGAYFVLAQCAQLITFVPQKIGQVMLASFSHFVASEDQKQLSGAYYKLCRLILILSTPIALFLILLSHPVASIFGQWSAERHLYLLALAFAAQIGALGSINSMLVLANEKTGYFAVNSIVLIGVQLAVTLSLLERWGVYAVIVGRIVSVISGQIGLFWIVRWRLNNIQLAPAREYWVAVLVVLIAATIATVFQPMQPLFAATGVAIGYILFLVLIRFRLGEATSLIFRKR